MTGQAADATQVLVAGHAASGRTNGHADGDAHLPIAVGVPARNGSSNGSQEAGKSHAPPAAVGSDQSVSGQSAVDLHVSGAADALVLIAADVLDDLERIRIATENRLRSLTHEPVEGERGGWFGKGLSPDMSEVRRVQAILDGLTKLERQATLDLCRAVRKHPLGDWVKRTVGVGEKQAGRLFAAIGNPADRATVSQLWAYCGYHVLNPGQNRTDTQSRRAGDPTDQGRLDPQSTTVGGEAHASGQAPLDAHSVSAGGNSSGNTSQTTSDVHRTIPGVAPTRRRGEKANWSSTAKMRAYLVAESCIKQCTSPYRAVYDAGREKYADAVHAHECKRCGPSGKPAQPGSPLSDGHKHARAMRLVAKEVLKDLWIEARRISPLTIPESKPTPLPSADTSGNGQSLNEPHRPIAAAAKANTPRPKARGADQHASTT